MTNLYNFRQFTRILWCLCEPSLSLLLVP